MANMLTGLFVFSYPLTRPYPYAWFKWVVFIGGILATAMFTSLSLASSGYTIHVRQTPDYNATMNARSWTRNWPFSLLAQPTTCLSNQMPVNTKFWTNKYGLPWTLTKVWPHDQGEVPILAYTNNPLENCSIDYLQVTLEPLELTGTQLMIPVGQAYTYQGQGNLRWNPRATAYVNCTINNGIQPTIITLSADYSYVTRAETMGSFPRLPQANQTSLWWGKSLLTWHWSKLSCVGGNSTYYMRAYGLLPRNDNPAIDISSQEYFSVPSFWLQDDPSTQAKTWSHHDLYQTKTTWSKDDSIDVRKEVDWFAKAMYAVVLADLGQSNGHPRDNALQHPELLVKLSSRIPELHDEYLDDHQAGIVCLLNDGPAQRAYQPGVDPPLNITPSYIATSYQCNVPIIKSNGSLFLSVLIADVVLLSSAWKLLNWLTQVWLEGQDPNANRCEGCPSTARSPYPQSTQNLISPTPLTSSTGYFPIVDDSQLDRRPRHQYHSSSWTNDIAMRDLIPK